MDNSDKLLVLVNLAVCVFGGWVCICRMGLMQGSKTKKVVRAQYILLFTSMVVSGISWVYGSIPTVAQLFLSAVIVLHLALGWGAWRHGPPQWVYRESRSC